VLARKDEDATALDEKLFGWIRDAKGVKNEEDFKSLEPKFPNDSVYYWAFFDLETDSEGFFEGPGFKERKKQREQGEENPEPLLDML